MNNTVTRCEYLSSEYKEKVKEATPRFEHPRFIAPGAGNVVAAPMDLIAGMISLAQLTSKADLEGKVDSIIQMIHANCSFPDGVFSLDNSLCGFLHSLKKSIYIGDCVPVCLMDLGLIVCTIGLIDQVISLKRSVMFFKKEFFDFDDLIKLAQSDKKEDKLEFIDKLLSIVDKNKDKFKSVDTDQLKTKMTSLKEYTKKYPKVFVNSSVYDEISAMLCVKKITQMQETYFSLSSKEMGKIEKKSKGRKEKREKYIKQALDGKKAKLSRRLRPWMAVKIEVEIPAILEDLTSESHYEKKQGVARCIKLFDSIHVQGKKLMIANVISIFALGLIIPLGLILNFYMGGFLLSTIVGVLGTFVGLARYIYLAGYQDREGWDFHFSDVIPDFLKDGVRCVKNQFKKIFSKKEPSQLIKC
jgi:hypothetical protein